MAILGNIIKGAIHLSDVFSKDKNPVLEQLSVLADLLDKAKDTAFGKAYNFRDIVRAEDVPEAFAEKVPIFNYEKMHGTWWHKIHKGEPDVTWPGIPDYFAVSSGTTGDTSKKIPVTDGMLQAIKNAGIAQVLAMRNFDLPSDFFEKEILMLGSSTNLTEHKGKLEGEISGISAENIPFWFRDFYKPGKEIAAIDDWDERVEKIAENAKQWDIGALSGIPSWIELMLKKVIEKHRAENIHQIWPNLQVYTSGGVAFKPYKKSFDALMGKPITVVDTYLASEGFIACQTRPETDAMQLLTNNGIYFEFVPFKPDVITEDGAIVENARAINLSDVEEGVDYVLIISTVSGAWRYTIGDTIAFTDVERAEIKITGRTKFFLNTVGSQLSVNKMNDAIKHLEEEFDTPIGEFTVSAKRIDGDYYHVWYLATENKSLDTVKVATSQDDFLKNANKNYKVARTKALKGVKVKLVKPDVFYDWNEKNKKKGGQVKMERVMDEEKFKEWEAFIGETV